MSQDQINWIYIGIELLVPIIPAFIFNWLLPSTTVVSGPLKGLKINLTGAFAGYFLLFFLVYLAPRPKGGEVWKVIGKIHADSGIATQYRLDCRVAPPLTNIADDNKSFELKVPIEVQEGKEVFPDIVVACKPDGKFETVTVHLDDAWLKIDPEFPVTRDTNNRTITIMNPIPIKTVEEYKPPTNRTLSDNQNADTH